MRKKGEEEVEDRLDPDKVIDPGLGSSLYDFFSPLGSGGERAGAAAALSEAAGKRPPATLRHPGKLRLLYTVLGAALGGVAGARLGSHELAATGSLIGMGGGMLADTIGRRRAISRAVTDFRESPLVEDDLPPTTEYSLPHKLVAPLSGSWRAGDALARRAIRDRDSDEDEIFAHTGSRQLADIGQAYSLLRLPTLGPVITAAGNVGQHLRANRIERELDKQASDDVPFEWKNRARLHLAAQRALEEFDKKRFARETGAEYRPGEPVYAF